MISLPRERWWEVLTKLTPAEREPFEIAGQNPLSVLWVVLGWGLLASTIEVEPCGERWLDVRTMLGEGSLPKLYATVRVLAGQEHCVGIIGRVVNPFLRRWYLKLGAVCEGEWIFRLRV
jgi:hypothetical protein